MRGMYLHAERLLAKAGRQGAREGDHPSLERKQSWSGKDEAQRRSAQAKRGRLWETLAPRQGSALSEVWFPNPCASAHRNCQGRVAAGTGRCGGKRRMRSTRSAGRRPPPARIRACL